MDKLQDDGGNAVHIPIVTDGCGIVAALGLWLLASTAWLMAGILVFVHIGGLDGRY